MAPSAGAFWFWAALIVAVAARSGARSLLTEDLNAGQVIAGVAIENPFAGSFPGPKASGKQGESGA